MTWYQSPDPQHPGQSIGVIGLLVIIGIAILVSGVAALSNRDRDQKQVIARQAREIARLSETCPIAEAGEQLVSTVRSLGKKDTLRCIYTSNSGYGRATRSRPAVPGRQS